MSANTPNNQDQEIDLSLLTKKISSFFEGISNSIFKAILFVKKNSIKFGVLFVLGAVLGYFLDINSNSYDSEVIVAPNFGTTDYLYSKIDLLQSKVKNGDTLFLKSFGIKNPNDIALIEINPIIDIYSFVNNNTAIASNAQNTQNFELVKLLSEDGDIKKVIKDKLTSKNYGHHTIHITSTKKISDKETIQPILNYLEQNQYFQDVRKVQVNNINVKMQENIGIVAQINALLNQFSNTTSNNQKSDKLVYYNENTQLNEIIATKNGLITEMGGQRMDLVNLSKIVKDISTTLNIKNTTGTNNKMKLILPILFCFLFVSYSLFMAFYRKQSVKISNI
jgi:hypothetical protein